MSRFVQPTNKNESLASGCFIFVLLAFFGSMIFLTYLSERERVPLPPTITYKPVVRVFLHERGHASFFVNEAHEIKHIDHGNCGVQFISDVPKDEPMWALYDTRTRETFIHIHDVKEVNGGAWNHGKFGQGTTNVVE